MKNHIKKCQLSTPLLTLVVEKKLLDSSSSTPEIHSCRTLTAFFKITFENKPNI